MAMHEEPNETTKIDEEARKAACNESDRPLTRKTGSTRSSDAGTRPPRYIYGHFLAILLVFANSSGPGTLHRESSRGPVDHRGPQYTAIILEAKAVLPIYAQRLDVEVEAGLRSKSQLLIDVSVDYTM